MYGLMCYAFLITEKIVHFKQFIYPVKNQLVTEAIPLMDEFVLGYRVQLYLVNTGD
jgi:hypothetical protein